MNRLGIYIKTLKYVSKQQISSTKWVQRFQPEICECEVQRKQLASVSKHITSLYHVVEVNIRIDQWS